MSAATQAARPDAGLRESYDREAVHYDRRRYESAEGRLFSDLEVRTLREWLPLGRELRILDVPSGTGRLTMALAETGATVIGADISANMLRVAASKCLDAAVDRRVHLMQGSGTHLPFPDATFDAVVSFKFFHLIPNGRKREFILEMTRVLKPGGALVAEFNSPFYGGILAWVRYTFYKKHPGGMRMKCLFPDQVRDLFEGLEVTRTQGVKLPCAAALSRVIGARATDVLNAWCGRTPGLRYLLYAIMIEARKPLGTRHDA